MLYVTLGQRNTKGSIDTDCVYWSYLCVSPWSSTKGQDAELQSLAAKLSDHLSNMERGEYRALLAINLDD